MKAPLNLVHWSAAAIVARQAFEHPSGRFAVAFGETVGRPSKLSAFEHNGLRVAAFAAGVLWATRVAPRITGPACLASAVGLDLAFRHVHPGQRSHLGHLHQTLAVLTLRDFVPGRYQPGVDLKLHRLLQLVVATAYAQSATSKLQDPGLRWAREPRVLRNALLMSGTPLGRALAHRPNLLRLAAWGTLGLELAVLPWTVAAPGSRPVLGALLVGFHGATAATLRISYWHLSWFVPSLFLDGLVARNVKTETERRHARSSGE